MFLAVLILAALPGSPSPDALSQAADMAAEARGHPVTMKRVEVTASVLGSIGVNFAMNKADASDPTATIFWATVVDVIPGSTAEKAGFKPGDEIVRLNAQLVRGLTLVEFLALIQKERLRGNLEWKVRRGLLGLEHLVVFNGKPAGKANAR